AVTVAAQIACLPILLVLQPEIPVYSVLANLLAEPLVIPITILGLVACMICLIFPMLSGSISLLASIPASINGFVAPPDTHVWAVIIFTALFATAIAFVIQTWSQARISTTKVAVILTMEVVFAALFSFMYGMEPFTLRLALGGTLVLIAMLAIVQPRVPSSSQS
ncbi:MAG: hypothetical protein EBY03_07165, partial [Actinobacteria bacterium]|nr:hypothetical protein [Actinomycetota bacterium]